MERNRTGPPAPCRGSAWLTGRSFAGTCGMLQCCTPMPCRTHPRIVRQPPASCRSVLIAMQISARQARPWQTRSAQLRSRRPGRSRGVRSATPPHSSRRPPRASRSRWRHTPRLWSWSLRVGTSRHSTAPSPGSWQPATRGPRTRRGRGVPRRCPRAILAWRSLPTRAPSPACSRARRPPSPTRSSSGAARPPSRSSGCGTPPSPTRRGASRRSRSWPRRRSAWESPFWAAASARRPTPSLLLR
mmetsp:Transcript_78405/g.243135  ORF Transcript_78405/g.243135 Transcript_78405/m.243135 type:complete len:244 (+) Transcript_78405:380-1111(+)